MSRRFTGGRVTNSIAWESSSWCLVRVIRRRGDTENPGVRVSSGRGRFLRAETDKPR